MLIFAKNFANLSKKTSKYIATAIAIVGTALLAGWLIAWPYPIIDADRIDNLVLTDDKPQCLATAAPVTILFNKCCPDRDNQHGKILVRRPLDIDTTSLYPVIVVQQDEHESFDSLAARWPAMDSCYVMVVGHFKQQALLQLVDTMLTAQLNQRGMRIDPNYITLVERASQHGLADKFGKHRVRNLVLTQSTDTSYTQARRIHLLPGDKESQSRFSQIYSTLMKQEVDADLYPIDTVQPLHLRIRDIALERNPISQTRLAFDRQEAINRGYDSQLVMFADFSIPSGKNRFFIYDYDEGEIIVRSKCAHGCGSGSTDAVPQFSNEHGSNATSLGLYEICDVHRMYKNGRVAINMEGLEESNSNARMRGIKVHGGMKYEGEIYPRYLRIGKLSEGCIALSNVPLSSVIIMVEQASLPILLDAYTH